MVIRDSPGHLYKNNMADDLNNKYNVCCDILCCNHNIPVLEINWRDITKAIAGLKLCTKYEVYRSQVTEEVICHSKNVIEKSFSLEIEKGCIIQTDIFRFLRNCCVDSRLNQERIINFEIFPMVMTILESALKHDKELPSHGSPDAVKQLIEAGIQLLGNLVTGHEKNQEIVWGKCYHTFFQSIMNSCHEKAKNYTCMVVYNCIRQNPRHELVTTLQGVSLVNDIADMCCKDQQDIEWGIFIIESLLKFGFFPQLYDGLSESYKRIFLLKLLESKLQGDEQLDHYTEWMSVNSAEHLSQMFEENIRKIIHCDFNFDDEETSSQVILVNSLLRLLCLLTAFSEEHSDLKNRVSLLENTLVALRETSSAENKKLFSNVSKFPSTITANTLQPTHGFKRNLVQLLANMCYHNKRNQDCVRQMDGITLLLDHCNIDDYNPYITQWAIFGLRNVCENNKENQEVIKSLQKLGLAKNERLSDAGIVVEETPDDRIKVFGRQTKDTS